MQKGGLTTAPDRPAPGVVDDGALMAAVIRGDKSALAALYDRHAGLLLAVATRILHDRAQAEDLLHDVFLEAWHRAREFNPERGTVRTWLVIRTRSRALDRRASNLRQARVADQLSRQPPVHKDGGALGVDAARVRGQVLDLPDELAQVIELAYFEGASSSEIADRVGIPVGTVKSRMARALSVLRGQLGPGDGGGDTGDEA